MHQLPVLPVHTLLSLAPTLVSPTLRPSPPAPPTRDVAIFFLCAPPACSAGAKAVTDQIAGKLLPPPPPRGAAPSRAACSATPRPALICLAASTGRRSKNGQ